MSLVAKENELPVAVNMLEVIERAALNPQVDIDKMRALLDMKIQIDARDAEMVFNRALNRCQSEIGRVAANKENKQTHSHYADYAALDRVVRPVYTKYGFSLSFNTGDSGAADVVKVICYVSHEDGHTRTYSVDMPADGKGAKGGDVMTKTHAAGSAMQYGQRYLLKLIFNVAIGLDDDGNGAGKKQAEVITEHEAANIAALMEETKANKKAFLDFFKIETVEQLPKARLKQAIEMLEKRRNK
jgi:hypothetical protein